MKKAQAAMEFLMTYGWAILVVLVAIGALAYFGVLSPEKFLPEKCVIATGSGLFCDDYAADATADTVTLRLKNILTDKIEIESITLAVTNIACSPYIIATNISADLTEDFDVSCTMESGDKIKGDITIAYHKVGGLSKSTSGNLVTTAS